MKIGLKETTLSVALFAGVLVALASVDDRVRTQLDTYVSADGVSAMTSRATAVGDAMVGAARYQTLEHSHLVAFAVISVVLVLFMVRS